MSDVHSKRCIKAIRKAQHCYQCDRRMEVGEPAEYAFGGYKGDVYSSYAHPECDKAAHEFAELNDMWGEEFPYFPEMDDSEYDHHGWLLEHHPIVAERLHVTAKAEAAE